jgi:hypothetical protein
MQLECFTRHLWKVAHVTARRCGYEALGWRRSRRDPHMLQIEARPRLAAAEAIHVVFERLLPDAPRTHNPCLAAKGKDSGTNSPLL